jgi:hypothetical protein
MKMIKEEHKPWCKFCPEKTVRAVWRSQGNFQFKHACDEHREDLKKYELENQDSGRMTEADHQTWGSL